MAQLNNPFAELVKAKLDLARIALELIITKPPAACVSVWVKS